MGNKLFSRQPANPFPPRYDPETKKRIDDWRQGYSWSYTHKKSKEELMNGLCGSWGNMVKDGGKTIDTEMRFRSYLWALKKEDIENATMSHEV